MIGASFFLLIAMLLFVGPIGAFVLQVSCWTYNAVVGGYAAAELEVNEEIRDESYNVTGPTDSNPFASPRQYEHRAELAPENGVRTPSFLKALLIVGIIGLSFAIVSVGLTLVGTNSVSGPGGPPGSSVRGNWSGRVVLLGFYLIEYFLTCILLMGLLPTKFVKSMIVAKLFFVIMGILFALVGVGFYFVAASNGVELTGVSVGTFLSIF